MHSLEVPHEMAYILEARLGCNLLNAQTRVGQQLAGVPHPNPSHEGMDRSSCLFSKQAGHLRRAEANKAGKVRDGKGRFKVSRYEIEDFDHAGIWWAHSGLPMSEPLPKVSERSPPASAVLQPRLRVSSQNVITTRVLSMSRRSERE